GRAGHDGVSDILWNNSNKLAIFGHADVRWEGPYYWLVQFEKEILSKSDLLSKSFTIHPNPTTQVIQINNQKKLKINKVEVFDMLGKAVISLGDNTEYIDLSAVQSGNYLIRIESESTSYYYKIIKL